MISRVVTIQTLPGKLDEAVAIYRDRILPLLRQQPGYQSVLLLADSQDKLMIIGLWDTETDLKAADTNPAIIEQVASFRGTFATPPTIENLQVRLR
jgi:heme-degrading monooxygenase HmoA